MEKLNKKKENHSLFRLLAGVLFCLLAIILLVISFFHPGDWENLIKLGMGDPFSSDMLWTFSDTLFILGLVFFIIGWILLKKKKDKFFYGTKKDFLKDTLAFVLFISPAPIILYGITTLFKNIHLTFFILLVVYGLFFAFGSKKLENYLCCSCNLYLDAKRDKKFLFKFNNSRQILIKRIGIGLLIVSLLFLYKIIFR